MCSPAVAMAAGRRKVIRPVIMAEWAESWHSKFGHAKTRILSTNEDIMFQDIFLFETRTGDEKDDKNSLQRFGVLHLLQREIVEGSVADFRERIGSL